MRESRKGGKKQRPLLQLDKKQIEEFESHKEGCEYVASTVREPEREKSKIYKGSLFTGWYIKVVVK